MRLDQFIAETLASVVNGVSQAQSEVQEAGAKVNPYRGSADAIQNIDFDVEISTAEGTATKGGLGVFVGPVAAGTQGQSDSSSSSVGRIRFKIPLELPKHPRRAGEN